MTIKRDVFVKKKPSSIANFLQKARRKKKRERVIPVKIADTKTAKLTNSIATTNLTILDWKFKVFLIAQK